MTSPLGRFDRNRLGLARRWRGLRKVDLAAAAGVSPSAITQYEQGRTRPSPAVVAALALRLGVPATFFDAGWPAPSHDRGDAHFRSLRSTPQLIRHQAIAWAELTWEVLRVMEQHVNLPAVDLPIVPTPPFDRRDRLDAAAQETRCAMGVTAGPIAHVVRLLEVHGVLVTRLEGNLQQVDAFSHWLSDRPLVLLNPAKGDAARSRFDAAHELCHLVMHQDADPGGRDIERQAHGFAASFLTPAEEIAAELPRRADWDQLIALKRRWGISIAALLYRSRELGIMRDVTYRNAMMVMSSRGWRQHEPGDIGVAEAPGLLGLAFGRLQAQGVGMADLAVRAGLPADLTERLVAAGSDN